VRRIVEAMRSAVSVPVTVKIRLGWNDQSLNYLDVARAAVDGGAAAIAVHGRTRQARYRHPADWRAIGEVVSAVPVPVVGNGDLLQAHEIAARLSSIGCAAVMVARGALIKPWLFREIRDGYWDISADERWSIYRRYVELARTHWGDDEHGRTRIRQFVRWHLSFWCRYAPRRADGSWPSMQERESSWTARSPLEALLMRQDDAALDYVTDELLNGGDGRHPPAVTAPAAIDEAVEAG
jgi:tRNA-dihydrouridine synthase 3